MCYIPPRAIRNPKGFKQQKWHSKSLNVTAIGATCEFVLVFHCNYVSILVPFPKFYQKLKRSRDPDNAPFIIVTV